MKKLFLTIVLIVSTFTYSQEYHFDYAFQYEHEINGEKHSRESVVNAQDHHYEMLFTHTTKESIAVLMDYENHVKHFYAFRSEKFPLKSENFIYQYSIKFPSLLKQAAAEDRRRFFTTTITENAGAGNIYTISEFYNAKKTRKRGDIVVKMKSFDADLSGFGLTYLLDYMNAGKKIKFTENLILENGTGNFDGNRFSIKLKYVEPQNFDLVIDEPIYR